ncbi:MAG: Gfo/Idh/MocA family oxidoreductase, partial [Proteobacteria bacterium]|nr:Gfo/Idh/MocA family oxidoreductase [Pseudomonadota bacterium]
MTIRLAIVGGNRGAYFDQVLGGLGGQIELTAICDSSDQVRAKWTENRPGLKAYSAFEDLVEDPEIDAVFIATPMSLHASQALTALNAGKHVLSEVYCKSSPTLQTHSPQLNSKFQPPSFRFLCTSSSAWSARACYEIASSESAESLLRKESDYSNSITLSKISHRASVPCNINLLANVEF